MAQSSCCSLKNHACYFRRRRLPPSCYRLHSPATLLTPVDLCCSAALDDLHKVLMVHTFLIQCQMTLQRVE